MPNAVKYKTGANNVTGSIQKSTVALGVTTGSIAGPTATTGWSTGITPSAGKYTITGINPIDGNPNIFCPVDDAELIRFVKSKGATGNNTASLSASLAWIGTQANLMAANFEYENIVTDGLVLNLDAGFVGSYPITGSTWYDISGNASNGTLTNGPTFNSANSGSLVFDGVDDYVSIPTTGILSGKNSFTISLWTYPSSFSGIQPLFVNYYVGNLEVLTRFNGTNIQFFTYSSTNVQVGGTTQSYSTLNQWVNIAFTYDGAVMKSYVNSIVSPTTFNRTGILNTSTLPYLLGRYSSPTEYRYSGRFAQTSVYLKALTASEVSQNFNAQRNRFGI